MGVRGWGGVGWGEEVGVIVETRVYCRKVMEEEEEGGRENG